MKIETSNTGNTFFYRKLFTLVLPIAFQQFMLTAVSASDALMLGFVSRDALSAVSLAGQITFDLKCDDFERAGNNIFAVPIGFLAAFYLNLPVVVVFLIINLDEVVKVPAAIIHYKKYGWLKNITREKNTIENEV